jgi:hypothetical protein
MVDGAGFKTKSPALISTLSRVKSNAELAFLALTCLSYLVFMNCRLRKALPSYATPFAAYML